MESHPDNMGVDGGFDALSYSYASPGGASGTSALHGERNLWCAVIAQAFMDIGAICAPTSGRQPQLPAARGREYDEAVRWLLRDTKSFTYICDLAGVSAPIIRRAAQVFYGRSQLATASAQADQSRHYL